MKLLGYTPDLDPTIEGVIVDCDAFIPDDTGMRSAPSAISVGLSTIPNAAVCHSATSLKSLDGVTRIFAGVPTTLYQQIGTGWTDIGRATAYNATGDNYWRFAQFGNTSLCANKGDVLQFSLTGNFADVTGAPKASIVETVGNFVFLFDTNEPTFGDSPNRWWCAALGEYDDWTPSISTQSATGLLTSSYGKIFAGKRLGDSIVAYKERAMYIGNYVGAPQIWNWQQIRGDAGCNSQEAVVDIGTPENPVHLFMGADDFWRFDGAIPIPIGAPVRHTIYRDLDFAFANRIKTVHDRVNTLVYFYYPGNGSNGILNKCVVYNYRQNKWGRDNRTIGAGLEFVTSGVNYDTIPYSTYDDIPNSLTYDSPFWTSGSIAPAVFNGNDLMTLTGEASNSSFTTGDLGDDTNYYLLQRVKPVWLTKPTSATLTNSHKYNMGDSLTEYRTTNMIESRFDVLLSSRWHRFRFNMTGEALLNEVKITYDNSGLE